jgi:hypothetical protein
VQVARNAGSRCNPEYGGLHRAVLVHDGLVAAGAAVLEIGAGYVVDRNDGLLCHR